LTVCEVIRKLLSKPKDSVPGTGPLQVSPVLRKPSKAYAIASPLGAVDDCRCPVDALYASVMVPWAMASFAALKPEHRSSGPSRPPDHSVARRVGNA
jgi:hypothetical protein